jgi:hypothetical protein
MGIWASAHPRGGPRLDISSLGDYHIAPMLDDAFRKQLIEFAIVSNQEIPIRIHWRLRSSSVGYLELLGGLVTPSPFASKNGSFSNKTSAS